MPRRNRRWTARKRPTGQPEEKAPTPEQLALRLVKAGRASPRILGPGDRRAFISYLSDGTTDNRSTDNREETIP